MILQSHNIAIITPVKSLVNLNRIDSTVESKWVIVYDSNMFPFLDIAYEKGHHMSELYVPGGSYYANQLNFALDFIAYSEWVGWLHFVMDDTIVHPDFYTEIKKILPKTGLYNNAYLFNQEVKSTVCNVSLTNFNKAHLGQVLVHTSLINKYFIRFKESPKRDYFFIEEVLRKALKPQHIDKVLSVRNYFDV